MIINNIRTDLQLSNAVEIQAYLKHQLIEHGRSEKHKKLVDIIERQFLNLRHDIDQGYVNIMRNREELDGE